MLHQARTKWRQPVWQPTKSPPPLLNSALIALLAWLLEGFQWKVTECGKWWWFNSHTRYLKDSQLHYKQERGVVGVCICFSCYQSEERPYTWKDPKMLCPYLHASNTTVHVLRGREQNAWYHPWNQQIKSVKWWQGSHSIWNEPCLASQWCISLSSGMNRGTGWMDADTDKKWSSLLWIRGTRPCELDCALITSLSIRYRILRLVLIIPVFWNSSFNKQLGISRGSYSLICQYHTICSILDVSTAIVRALKYLFKIACLILLVFCIIWGRYCSAMHPRHEKINPALPSTRRASCGLQSIRTSYRIGTGPLLGISLEIIATWTSYNS